MASAVWPIRWSIVSPKSNLMTIEFTCRATFTTTSNSRPFAYDTRLVTPRTHTGGGDGGAGGRRGCGGDGGEGGGEGGGGGLGGGTVQ